MFTVSHVIRAMHIVSGTQHDTVINALLSTNEHNQKKFNRLVFGMTFIKNHKPNLNIQTDCIRAKLFNYYCSFLTVELFMTHCYFGMYRLQLANFFFDLIVTFIQLLECL